MQDPNIQLTILSKMAHKPEVKFEKLYQKLYMLANSVRPRKQRENWRAGYLETCKSGSEGSSVKPNMATCQGARFLPYPDYPDP